MKYADPLEVTCDGCGREGEYRVKSLLSLTAECDGCGASLSAVGQRMRETINENAADLRLVDTILDLESQFSIVIPDSDIAEIRTVDDLVALTVRMTGSKRPEVESIVASSIRAHAPSGREIRPEMLLQTVFREYES